MVLVWAAVSRLLQEWVMRVGGLTAAYPVQQLDTNLLAQAHAVWVLAQSQLSLKGQVWVQSHFPERTHSALHT